MSMTVRQFRREAKRRRAGRKRGAPRYRPEQREFAVNHGVAVRASGGSISQAAEELGISDMTLSTWLRGAASGGRLREVRVSSDAGQLSAASGPGAVVVTTAGGETVTGLTVEQVAQLLRALR